MTTKQPLIKLGQGPKLKLIREEDLTAWVNARASGALIGMLLMLVIGWLSGLVTAWLF